MNKLILLLIVLFFSISLFSQQTEFDNQDEASVLVEQTIKELQLNSSTKVLDSIIAYGLIYGEPFLSRIVNYEYDQKGRQTRAITRHFSSVDSLTPTSIEDLVFGYADNEEYWTRYHYKNGDTTRFNKYITFYLDDGTPIAKLIQDWDATNMTYVNDLIDTFFYFNTVLQLDSTLRSRWNREDSQWEEVYALRSFYNPAGLEESLQRYLWDTLSQSWELSSSIMQEYDLLDNQTVRQTCYWNDSFNACTISDSTHSHYNGNTLIDSLDYFRFTNANTINGRKEYYTYENDLLIADTIYTWSIDELYGLENYSTYSYDIDGDIQTRVNYNYNNFTAEIPYISRWYYYYTDIEVATQEVAASQQNCTFANPHYYGTPLSCNWTNDAPTHFKVYNLQGVLQYQKRLNKNETAQNFVINKALPTGIYFAIWEGENRILEQQKLLIP